MTSWKKQEKTEREKIMKERAAGTNTKIDAREEILPEGGGREEKEH